ncbi:MAG: hypothetical protein WCJ30_05065 [Deltaproteobacteria bacterium]
MTEDPTRSEPLLPQRGLLAAVRPEAVLRFCETAHFSGTLSFTTTAGKGLLPVLDGVPEVTGDPALEAALDEFLGLTEGTYTLRQIMPDLEPATRDSDLAMHGATAGSGIPDLMRYCESAGLTGTLRLTRGEETCDARYEHGELVSIVVDREEDQNLERVFAWPDGAFAIAARALFEAAMPSRRVTAPEPQLLKTLEVALAEIMDQRSRGESVRPAASPFRAPSLRSLDGAAFGVERAPGAAPSLRAPTQPGARRTLSPPPQHSADTTVKVMFVARAALPDVSATRHAAANLGSEQVVLDLPTRSLGALTEQSAGAAIAAHVPKSETLPEPEALPASPTQQTPAPAPAEPPETARTASPVSREQPFSPWTAVLAAISITATLAALWMLYTLVR